MKIVSLLDEVGGLEVVGCAHRSLDCGISLKEPQNVPKFSNFMEDFKFDVDLHNGEGEKERQDEEGQDHHEEDKISDLGGEDPQPEPVPEPETDELKQNIPRLQKPAKQNAKYMENILSKMEKSLNKDDLKLQNDLANLPDPATMLLEQVGPVARVSLQNIPKQRKAKVIVIAREHSGYPVLGQFFTQDNDFFVHGEPPVKTETVLNLLNCVLAPEMVHNFSDLIQKDFGQTSYFRSSCLLDSDSVCSDPLSYENKCSTCPYQVLKSKHFSLTFAKDLMEAEADVRVIYLVRDPRGVLR